MDIEELEKLISDSLFEFHRRRLGAAQKIQTEPLLRRKNPYLYKALGIEVAAELIDKLLESHLKESDETIFGDAFFEPLARLVSGGTKSPTAGVDFFIESDERYLAVAVKSGPNPFNASQKRRQNTEFNALKARLHTLQKWYDPLLGHAYGRGQSEAGDVRNYRERSGQAFWEELTGDPAFYIKVITLMKEEPLKYKDEFSVAWAAVKNKLTMEFSNRFCLPDGRIDWESWVRFVSEKRTPKSSLSRKKK